MCRQDPFKQNRGNNKKIKGVLISYCSFLSIIKENQVNYFQLRAKSLWISPISQFLRSSYYIDTPPFGQRPRRGRSPVEHRGLSFVRSFVRPFVRPPQALSGLKSDLSGLKSALLGLKSALSGLESTLSGLKSAFSGLKPVLPGFKSPLQIQGLRWQISSLRGQISGLRRQISGLRGPGGD